MLFLEKYRQEVHLRQSDLVPIQQKWSTFQSLIVPDSPADIFMQQFDNRTDTDKAYDECIRQLWHDFGMNRDELKAIAKAALKAIRPLSDSNTDQLAFVSKVIASVSQVNNLIQCGIRKIEARKKGCPQILEFLSQDNFTHR